MSKYRHPSIELSKIIPKPSPKPIWNRDTPTVLEYTISLINSSPLVLFSRQKCSDSKKLYRILRHADMEFRAVDLERMPEKLGFVIQRRLRDLTGQWTAPHLFAKSQSIGGLDDVQEALEYGKVQDILGAEEWYELVYAVRPDALVRGAAIKQKSPLSFAMGVQDSHRFSYVHRERWAKVKRHWGELPEIEGFPLKHKFLEHPKPSKGWRW
ncbi:hypothetical protein IW140_006333 [Coemansia sp. RSA 1813]|nr:Glutaredoxin-1 [Coemansia sp. RSA 1646]KAJ1765932.1 hypothetical protein LPJ74_006131 [Coemansia sp. RSA 1843]KAJ2085440.1 hypothetical protein IW138_006332 [Coemansia sp. RSA 986]KAJ2210399.1 hypothetical protein EV179_006276 [Coemansia sp. RSA 487]KAJ2562779.1 hypothetical protein IW140_006333 [Coemansia sp. RSA 1813]